MRPPRERLKSHPPRTRLHSSSGSRAYWPRRCALSPILQCSTGEQWTRARGTCGTRAARVWCNGNCKRSMGEEVVFRGGSRIFLATRGKFSVGSESKFIFKTKTILKLYRKSRKIAKFWLWHSRFSSTELEGEFADEFFPMDSDERSARCLEATKMW